jgi:DNA-3-methyladenine glycosylase I
MGEPQRDPRALWGKLILNGFQAGLSWRTIFIKRTAFRSAFMGFDPATVASFADHDVNRLLTDASIVRSRMKIMAAIKNARAYLIMRERGEDFAVMAWKAVDCRTILGDGTGSATRSEVADDLSKILKTRGFSFVGPVIVHAWMQASGLINDHEHG